MKTLTTGDELLPQPDGTYLLKNVKIETFRDTGDTNAALIMQAPSCIFDRNQHNASSPGPLQIDSGDGNIHIEGEGFVWLAGDTNASLTISNKVHTIIRKQYLAGQTNADVTTPPPPVSAKSPSGTNQIINVFSDHFHYDRQTDLITYSDHVQAEDSQITLTCNVMTVQRTTNGTVETIVGDGNVVIVNKAGGARTIGDHAVYTSKPGKQEEVVMTGNPRLLEGRREGTGKVFIFDQLQHTLRIEGDAYLKLPRDSIGQTGLLLGPPPATNNPASNAPTPETNDATNKFVEIYSDSMLFQMPPTNGPVQKVFAERNVIILDPERNSRGAGNHAVYTDATGLLELRDNAMWQSDQRVAKGGLLIFDRNNKALSVRTNAYLKLPAAAFGNGSASTNAAATNRFVAVLCDHYDYRDNVLTFHDQAQAALLESELIKGTLNCGTLTATFNTNNQLQTLRAEGEVYGRLLPAPASEGSTVEKDIKCDLMTLNMRTNWLVEQIVASQKVLATQTQTFTNDVPPVRQTLNSDEMTTTFQPSTNAVAKIVAERDVVITRADMTATGARAIYTASDDMARLTGDPLVVLTNGTLRGTVIALDRRNNKLLASQSKIVLKVDTNRFASQPTAKKPSKKKPAT